jgi:PPOX class probable F420-dependent enzyme
MAELTDEVQTFLNEPHIASFVTLMRNGSPQVTPVWVDHDGANVLINTAEGRQKALNLRRDPRVAVCVIDDANTQRYVQVRGRVVEMVTGDAAWQHIDKLSLKYNGNPNYPRRPGEERILLKIEPEHVTYRTGRRP